MSKFLLVNEVVVKTGTEHVPLYIVVGRKAMIIDGGILPDLQTAGQVIVALNEEVEISHWFITHAHYDHCGLLPYLRDLLPACAICCSAEAARILKRQTASDFIETQNREMNSLSGTPAEITYQSSRRYAPDLVLQDGDEVDLGKGVKVEIFNAAGHSLCSLAAWLPRQRILFPSDALGSCYTPEDIMPLVFHSFHDYISTNRLLANLRAEWVFPGHHHHISGPEASGLCDGALEGIYRFYERYLRFEKRLGHHEAISALEAHYYDHTASFISGEILHASIERVCQLMKECV